MIRSPSFRKLLFAGTLVCLTLVGAGCATENAPHTTPVQSSQAGGIFFPPAIMALPLPGAKSHSNDERQFYPKSSELPAVPSFPIGAAPTADSTEGSSTRACIAKAPNEIASNPGFTEFGMAAFDSSGKAIENIQESGLSASVDGRTIPIAMFNGASPADSIVILVDTSGSMTPKIPSVQRGIRHFVENLPPQDDVALFAFSSHLFLLQPFTHDHAVVENKLAMLHAYGQTTTFDSLAQAATYLTANGANPKRAILLVTDGMDNASAATAGDVAKQIKQSGISLFAIGIGDPNSSAGISFAIGPFALPNFGDADRVDAATLQMLADASGGKLWLARTVDDTRFASAIDAATHSLGTAYSVGVILPAPIKRHTTVHFAIKDHPDAKISLCEAVPPTPPAVATAAQ